MTDISIRIHPGEQRIMRLLLLFGAFTGIIICLATTVLVSTVVSLSELDEAPGGGRILLMLYIMYGATAGFLAFSIYYTKRVSTMGIDVKENIVQCKNVLRTIRGPVGSLTEVRLFRRGRMTILRLSWHYQSTGIGGTLCDKEQLISYRALRKSPREGLEGLMMGLHMHGITVRDEL